MSLYVNHMAYAGNLTAEPEIIFLGKDKTPKAQFRIAYNRRFRAGNEMREETLFLDCEAWGRAAELLGEFVDKGDNIHIEGSLKQDTWDDKETGRKNSRIVLRAASIKFVELRGPKADRRRESAKASGKPVDAPTGHPADLPDEPPF